VLVRNNLHRKRLLRRKGGWLKAKTREGCHLDLLSLLLDQLLPVGNPHLLIGSNRQRGSLTIDPLLLLVHNHSRRSWSCAVLVQCDLMPLGQ
jgi:hypothetical protein